MKCPKCQYVGYDAGDRCRLCGFEFALVTPLSTPGDLPLQATEADLPLLPDDDLPLASVTIPPPRPAGQPISVRRSSSDTQKARRYPRPVEPAPAPLPLDEPLDEGTPQAAAGSGSAERPDALDREATGTGAGMTAALSPRLLAALIDVGVWLGVSATIVWATLRVTELPLSLTGVRLLSPMPLLGMCTVTAIVYQVVGLVGCGQTLGKMLMGIHVQMRDGGGIGIDTAVARAAFAVAAVASLGILYLPFLLMPGRRTLHDRLAGTEVVAR